MNNFNVFSFDVFDTCLARTYEQPSDIFYQLGLAIYPNKKNINEKHIFATNFQSERIRAERQANRMHGRKRSCHLNEIYSLLELSPQCTFSKFDIMRLELEHEERCIYGIKATKDIIDAHRKEGKRIIFISDMYLDVSFIKHQLIKHDFFQEGDGLYVSSESSLIKRTGMLFKLVLQKENIQAHEIFHTGDNLECDIIPANKMGIQTYHIKNTLIAVNEIALSKSDCTPIERRVNSIPKYIRLSNPNAYTSAELKLFSIITPAIISFTLWSLQQAADMGLDRLYFVSRNGELPYKVAKLLASRFPQIDIKFLYGSRKAWILPSMSNETQDWKYALPRKSTCSIKELLERLSFEDDEITHIASIAKQHGISVDTINKSKITLDNFLNIIDDSEINKFIFAKISNARALIMEYLDQEGLLSDDQWAIVDSGWALNCQAYLNRIIKSIFPLREAKGLYFGMVPNHLPKEITGPAVSFTDELSIFSQRGYVVENCFLFSALQSTCGYIRHNGKAIPEFSNLSHSDFEINYSNKIYSFIEEYIRTINVTELPVGLFIEQKDALAKNLALLVSKPNRELSLYLSSLKINENLKHDDTNSLPLCRALSKDDLVNQIAGFFNSKVKRPQIWLEASIFLSSYTIGALFRVLIYLNRMRYLISNHNLRRRKRNT